MGQRIMSNCAVCGGRLEAWRGGNLDFSAQATNSQLRHQDPKICEQILLIKKKLACLNQAKMEGVVDVARTDD